MQSFLAKQISPEGLVLEDGTSANTTKHYGILIRENTVISAWADEDGNDLVAKYGISGKGLLVTDPIMLVPGDKIGATITLTSGSIWILPN